MLVGEGLVSIEREWVDFKKVIDGTEKTLRIQTEYAAPIRTCFALDQNIVYVVLIYDAGFEPTGWSAGQITANDTARDEFDDDWASTANRQVDFASVVKHYNGTATTSPASVDFDPRSASILIHNTDTVGANNLLVSFDGGSTFKTFTKGVALSFNAVVGGISIKSSAGSVPYEIVVVS